MGTFYGLVNRSPRLCLIAGAALVALAGCSVAPDQRGNLPDPTILTQIKPGSTDKAAVTRLIGSPSSIAAFDANTWYYISEKTKTVAFLQPELLDQQVVAIDFDDTGIVRDVRHRDIGDRELVTPNPNATPAPGREFSFIEQLIGNFGKFNNNSNKTGDNTHGGGGP